MKKNEARPVKFYSLRQIKQNNKKEKKNNSKVSP